MNSDKFWKECAHCGASLGLDNWPPLVETVNEADTPILSFCDEGCRSAWGGE